MTDLKPVKTAVIGCGDISDIYFKNTAGWKILDVIACSSLNRKNAEMQGAKYNIPHVLQAGDIMADPEIELVLNLTVPEAHAEIALSALRAGKHIYNEKPLAIRKEDAQTILREANSRGLYVGCAPDTFLDAGLQTCRRIVDEGSIGQVVAVTAHFLACGPEYWHPNPEFLFKAGAGPLFDMGPYYLTALISFFGPVHRVTGIAKTTYTERIIRSQPKKGTKIKVETPTNIAGILEFKNGVVATLVTTFDIGEYYRSAIEIYGSEGTIKAPDPNTFGGPVRLRKIGEKDWVRITMESRFTENSRGIGLADMAYAIRTGRPHRCNGEMAFHVLDVMQAILESSDSGKHIRISSTCGRPAPLPDVAPGELFKAMDDLI
ncbi:MAG: Gfo/Idh/MocA family oxidoreductase [Deltaproteobacteria bacterium]|nr:Gfo/Idh/MocA family oxidoreductase [Deltaproteobacteria bacterium]